MNKKIIINNQKLIKNAINPIKPLNLFLEEFNDQNIKVNIANVQSLPIEIVGLFQNKINIGKLSKYEMILGKNQTNFQNMKYLNLKIMIR